MTSKHPQKNGEGKEDRVAAVLPLRREPERETVSRLRVEHAEWVGRARVKPGLNGSWALDIAGRRVLLHTEVAHAAECNDPRCRPSVDVFGRRWSYNGTWAEFVVPGHGGLVEEEVQGHILRAVAHPRGYHEYFHQLRTGPDPRFGGMTEAEYDAWMAGTDSGHLLLTPTHVWRQSLGGD